jgi:hypothetical protein
MHKHIEIVIATKVLEALLYKAYGVSIVTTLTGFLQSSLDNAHGLP